MVKRIAGRESTTHYASGLKKGNKNSIPRRAKDIARQELENKKLNEKPTSVEVRDYPRELEVCFPTRTQMRPWVREEFLRRARNFGVNYTGDNYGEVTNTPQDGSQERWVNVKGLSDEVHEEREKLWDDQLYKGPKTAWARVCSHAIGYEDGYRPDDPTHQGFIMLGSGDFYETYGFTPPGQGDVEGYNVIGYDVDGKPHMITEDRMKHRPSPGITGVDSEDIEPGKNMRKTTITFTCHSRDQLDYLEAYFLQVGITLSVEWGWNTYPKDALLKLKDIDECVAIFNNETRVDTSDRLAQKFKNNPELYGKGEGHRVHTESREARQDPDGLIGAASMHLRGGEGNYGFIFGMLHSFDFSINASGGYDCSVKISSMSEIAHQLHQTASKKHKEKLKEVEGEGKEKQNRFVDERFMDLETFVDGTLDKLLVNMQEMPNLNDSANSDSAQNIRMYEPFATDKWNVGEEETRHTQFTGAYIKAYRDEQKDLGIQKQKRKEFKTYWIAYNAGKFLKNKEAWIVLKDEKNEGKGYKLTNDAMEYKNDAASGQTWRERVEPDLPNTMRPGPGAYKEIQNSIHWWFQQTEYWRKDAYKITSINPYRWPPEVSDETIKKYRLQAGLDYIWFDKWHPAGKRSTYDSYYEKLGEEAPKGINRQRFFLWDSDRWGHDPRSGGFLPDNRYHMGGNLWPKFRWPGVSKAEAGGSPPSWKDLDYLPGDTGQTITEAASSGRWAKTEDAAYNSLSVSINPSCACPDWDQEYGSLYEAENKYPLLMYEVMSVAKIDEIYKGSSSIGVKVSTDTLNEDQENLSSKAYAQLDDGIPAIPSAKIANPTTSDGRASASMEAIRLARGRFFTFSKWDASKPYYAGHDNSGGTYITIGYLVDIFNLFFAKRSTETGARMFQFSCYGSRCVAHPNIKSMDGKVLLIPNSLAPRYNTKSGYYNKSTATLSAHDDDPDYKRRVPHGSIYNTFATGHTSEAERTFLKIIAEQKDLDSDTLTLKEALDASPRDDLYRILAVNSTPGYDLQHPVLESNSFSSGAGRPNAYGLHQKGSHSKFAGAFERESIRPFPDYWESAKGDDKSLGYSGRIADLLVNLDTVQNNIESGETAQEMLEKILAEVSGACGNIWKFQCIGGDATAGGSSTIVQVVDHNYSGNFPVGSQKDKAWVFRAHQGNSIIRGMDMSVNLSAAVSSQVLYGGDNDEENRYYQRGRVDRILKESTPPIPEAEASYLKLVDRDRENRDLPSEEKYIVAMKAGEPLPAEDFYETDKALSDATQTAADEDLMNSVIWKTEAGKQVKKKFTTADAMRDHIKTLIRTGQTDIEYGLFPGQKVPVRRFGSSVSAIPGGGRRDLFGLFVTGAQIAHLKLTNRNAGYTAMDAEGAVIKLTPELFQKLPWKGHDSIHVPKHSSSREVLSDISGREIPKFWHNKDFIVRAAYQTPYKEKLRMIQKVLWAAEDSAWMHFGDQTTAAKKDGLGFYLDGNKMRLGGSVKEWGDGMTKNSTLGQLNGAWYMGHTGFDAEQANNCNLSKEQLQGSYYTWEWARYELENVHWNKARWPNVSAVYLNMAQRAGLDITGGSAYPFQPDKDKMYKAYDPNARGTRTIYELAGVAPPMSYDEYKDEGSEWGPRTRSRDDFQGKSGVKGDRATDRVWTIIIESKEGMAMSDGEMKTYKEHGTIPPRITQAVADKKITWGDLGINPDITADIKHRNQVQADEPEAYNTSDREIDIELVDPDNYRTLSAMKKDSNPMNNIVYNHRLDGMELSLTLDGIEGIRLWDVFNCAGVPVRYFMTGIFAVNNIKQSIKNNDWTTEITAQFHPDQTERWASE